MILTELEERHIDHPLRPSEQDLSTAGTAAISAYERPDEGLEQPATAQEAHISPSNYRIENRLRLNGTTRTVPGLKVLKIAVEYSQGTMTAIPDGPPQELPLCTNAEENVTLVGLQNSNVFSANVCQRQCNRGKGHDPVWPACFSLPRSVMDDSCGRGHRSAMLSFIHSLEYSGLSEINQSKVCNRSGGTFGYGGDWMILLHIGRHKTGTTRLQEFLTRNRNRLPELGFEYPILHRGEIAHHSVARHLIDPSTENNPAAVNALGAQDIRTLKASFDATSNATIISSEALQNTPARRARELVGRRPTKIIAYFREQASYAMSAYCQHVLSTRYVGTFNDFLPKFYESVNYNEFMHDWAGEFGMENVRLRVYDRDKLVGEDIRSDFLSILGIACDSFDFTDWRETDTVCGDLLKMKILLNKQGFDERVLRAKGLPMRKLAREHPEMSAKPRITKRTTEAIRAQYAPQNNKFFAQFPIENGTAFTLLPLPEDNGGPFLDQNFDFTDIPLASAIVDELHRLDPEIGDLFYNALASAGIIRR